jgi:plasmid stabilization system protein ParE
VPRNLDFTDEAADDLAAMRRWYSQPGAAAKRRAQAIVDAIERLRDMPCLPARGRRPGTREFTAQGHRIIYRVDPDTDSNTTAGDVLVLRVFGPGQDRSAL